MNLDYALKYLTLGWLVLPLHWVTDKGICSCGNPQCKSPAKHPLVKRGVKAASTDPAIIAQWVQKWPKANIGIATGAVSGLFALDVDPRHDGRVTLDNLEDRHGRLSSGIWAHTGGNGFHILFKYSGPECRSTTNLFPGIDTRGDNGYIVVEPSNHIGGGQYHWIDDDPLDGAKLSDMPAWLLTQLRAKNRPTTPKAQPVNGLSHAEIKKIRDALGYIPADDRDTWLHMGMALNSSKAGDQVFNIWCEWAQQSDKFNLADSRRVWGSIKIDKGITLATLFATAKRHGWLPPESGKRPQPPLSIYEADATAQLPQQSLEKKSKHKNGAAGNPDLFKRFVFLKDHNRILDTVTRNELSREGFDGGYCHLFEGTKPSTVFLKNPETVKVDGLIYLPGETGNPVYRGGAILWNIWSDPGGILPSEATREDVEPWLEHLRYLFPTYEEQEHLLNWMACIVQRPQVKINHAVLIAGTPRVGKDMLLQPLRYGLGPCNVSEPPADELKESFTDYLRHSKLVIFQEIQIFEGLHLENKLKPMLAAPPDMLRVRLFGRGFYETPNIVQAIFMSNYRDALHISEGDGRYFTVWTDALPLSQDYYYELWSWLEGGGNALVVRWLLDRDLSGFDPKRPAPITHFKTAMLATSKSPLRHQLEDMIAAGDYPCNVDCVRSLDIAKTMREKYSAKAIGSVLSEIGCLPKICRRAIGRREEVSLYAVRNCREWEQLPPAKWLEEYDSRRD